MYPNRPNQQRPDILPPVQNRPLAPRPPQPHNTQPQNIHPQNFHQQIPQERPYHLPENKGSSKLKTVLLILLVIFLIGGAAYGGYYYANYEDKKNNTSTDTSKSQNDTSESSIKASNNEALSSVETHFVSRTGFPYDLKAKKSFTVNLGLPSIVQGVGVASSKDNRGQEQYYTDKFNDEIGRWEIGYPAYSQSPTSQISVLALSKSWLALNQPDNHAFDDSAIKLATPAQKKTYVAKIKSDAGSCVKDKAKGFTTNDGIFNVCFSVIPGRESFTPILVFRGYGDIENQPMILTGFISLEEGKSYSDAENKKLLSDAKENKLPNSTVQLIDTFVGSLKATTLKINTI